MPPSRLPSHAAIVRVIATVGFINIRLEKLSPTAHFTVDSVALREIVAVCHKSGHRSGQTTHAAIYLGPLAQVQDDFGNVFRRGERVPLNIHDWQLLSKSAAASCFLLQ